MKKNDFQIQFSIVPNGEQGATLSTALDLQTLEAHLWEAANASTLSITSDKRNAL